MLNAGQSGNLPHYRLLLLTSDGEEIVVDHAVIAVGLEPNTDLAKSSGLELDDKLGGFRHVLKFTVLARLRTLGGNSCDAARFLCLSYP